MHSYEHFNHMVNLIKRPFLWKEETVTPVLFVVLLFMVSIVFGQLWPENIKFQKWTQFSLEYMYISNENRPKFGTAMKTLPDTLSSHLAMTQLLRSLSPTPKLGSKHRVSGCPSPRYCGHSGNNQVVRIPDSVSLPIYKFILIQKTMFCMIFLLMCICINFIKILLHCPVLFHYYCC